MIVSRETLMGVTLAAALAAPTQAGANGFAELGKSIDTSHETTIEVDGHFRSRGAALVNLDLDRGPTTSGLPLYAVPASSPTAQTLLDSDLRLRADISAIVPEAAIAVHTRIDALDVGFGSTPDAPPQATTSQRPVAMQLRRAYGEALTPFGLLAVGRMGSDWGLGMLTNGGGCLDCDSGDAADRIAFVTPIFRHIWAIGYDIASSGREAMNARGKRLDVDPDDDVRQVTFAAMRYHSDRSLERRARAGLTTFDYGFYFSFRWQDRDVPSEYLPLDSRASRSAPSMRRDLRAFGTDIWLRLSNPYARVEAEAAFLSARIGEASVVPGVSYADPLTSEQWGAAVETSFGRASGALTGGVDGGFASGDAAYGFGAFPDPFQAPPAQGDLDGLQANPPFDSTVDNFRFHPDYHVDRILFREIIGTVTDAAYVRPHVDWRIGRAGPGVFLADLGVVASWAIRETSTPSGKPFLGVEIDPRLRYQSHDAFQLTLEHALFLPGAAFDNPTLGLDARAAQLVRARLDLRF